MDLYVSDLDGTLLNENQEISDETAEIINGLIEAGLHFTIATARSIVSATPIIAKLNLTLPLTVNNGVFVYDPIQQENILSNFIPNEVARRVSEEFEEYGVSPQIFSFDETNGYQIHYQGIFHPGEDYYISGRLSRGDQRFVLCNDFKNCLNRQIITFVAINDREKLEPLYHLFQNNYDLVCHFGEDIYSKAYWLEVTVKNANKQGALRFLRKYLGAKQVICFGDGLNDLSMFEIADECYAVQNAHPDVKKAAAAIIGANTKDGVARFLEGRLKLEESG